MADDKPTKRGNGFKDLTGREFERLTVLRYDSPVEGKKDHWWLCMCECGNEVKVRGSLMRHKQAKSCGCLYKDSRGKAKKTHGLSNTPEYMIWSSMHGRCKNPTNTLYPKYGAKGVTVCERWNSFEAFLADMGPRPSPEHSIDRKSNSEGYTPENCHWATRNEQAQNRTIVRLETYNGETRPLIEWARIYNINYRTLRGRMFKMGWSFEKAITTPVN